MSSPEPDRSRPPTVARGVLLALGSAIAFGLTTPWIARAGRGLGPFSTAALLYVGAAIATLVLGRFVPPSGAPVRRRHLGRLVAIAACGGFLAPVALAFGIQRTGATTAALLLNLEAVFTSVLAASFLGEPIGRRVAIAMVVMTAGGALLALDHADGAAWSILGVAAVAVASIGWAADNVLSRPLAELEPLGVITAKGLFGAAASGSMAVALGEPLPSFASAAALLACGATGYGMSLRLYLLAQRRMGAARTASIFAVAPFLGAAVAWGLGDRGAGLLAAAGAMAFAVGVYLHATERHDHEHVHHALDHEHPHRHDDGHHAHFHSPAIGGSHTHSHRHERTVHRHEHAPDVHHDHHR